MVPMELKQPHVIDELIEFKEDYTDPVAGTQLVIQRTHDIPDDHISQLKRDKIDTLHTPMGDWYRVASIPISVVQKWDREGFKIEDHNIHEVLKRLNKESLDAFITTRKQF
jgi:hypothetical protein